MCTFSNDLFYVLDESFHYCSLFHTNIIVIQTFHRTFKPAKNCHYQKLTSRWSLTCLKHTQILYSNTHRYYILITNIK